MRNRMLGMMSAAVLMFGTAAAAAGVLPGPVVSAKWLHDNLDKVVVVDVRDDVGTFTTPPEYYEADESGHKALYAAGGHIDGALLIEFGKLRVSREVGGKKISKLLPDRAYVEDLMQSAGLTKGKPIVITTPGETGSEVEEAARLYWTLKYYGADQMAVLDGGNAAWLMAGFPVSTKPAAAVRGDWQATAERKELLADTAGVEQGMKKGVQFVDARSLDQYLGLNYKKPSVAAGGHLAGAKSFPRDIRTRASGDAQMFLSAQEYRGVMAAQGISLDAPTVTYCNTGHMASGAWFIQSEILGGKDVRLYDGSMHEWTTLGHPVVGLAN